MQPQLLDFKKVQGFILHGIRGQNFKNRAFVDLVTFRTHPIDTLSILLASPLLSVTELQTVATFQAVLISLRHRFPDPSGSFPVEDIFLTAAKAMNDLFEQNLISQGGMLKPSRMILTEYLRTLGCDRSHAEFDWWVTVDTIFIDLANYFGSEIRFHDLSL